jgi:transcriptional regulator with XRE-family HTH domain
VKQKSKTLPPVDSLPRAKTAPQTKIPPPVNRLPNNKIAEELRQLGRNLAATRVAKGLSQAALAARCGLTQSHISHFEQSKRLPTLDLLIRLAGALDAPLQRLLTGTDRPGKGLQDIALELRQLGVADLWVNAPVVPGAFRRPEEVVALAVAGEEPEARILEAIPAVLAWNRWSGPLLRAYGTTTRPRTVYRLAWLAEVVLALDKRGGFPGGCPGRHDLAAFAAAIKAPSADKWDSLGRPALEPPASALWKRWRIAYAGDLQTFQARAEGLASLHQAQGSRPAFQEG